MTDYQLNLAVQEIETRGQGLSNYMFPARDYAQPDLPTITYIGFNQTIWYLDKRICQGINEEGLCTWLTMSEDFRDYLSWIPYLKDRSYYSPMIFLATWYGVIYIIDFIEIAMNDEREGRTSSIKKLYNTEEDLQNAEARPNGPGIRKFKRMMKSKKFRYIIWERADNTTAFINTFGINFGESPQEALIDHENMDCWVKIPVMDFQAITGETMYAFISGYLFPKISLFNPERWEGLKGRRLLHPGLEHCVLAMGPMKYSPWYIAKILESHIIQSNGVCPGTDIHLTEYLQETFSEGFLEFYEGTLQPIPSTSVLFKEVSQKERENKLRL